VSFLHVEQAQAINVLSRLQMHFLTLARVSDRSIKFYPLSHDTALALKLHELAKCEAGYRVLGMFTSRLNFVIPDKMC
jgi:hypothetical protein